jgi:hypothetical protein
MACKTRSVQRMVANQVHTLRPCRCLQPTGLTLATGDKLGSMRAPHLKCSSTTNMQQANLTGVAEICRPWHASSQSANKGHSHSSHKRGWSKCPSPTPPPPPSDLSAHLEASLFQDLPVCSQRAQFYATGCHIRCCSLSTWAHHSTASKDQLGRPHYGL